MGQVGGSKACAGGGCTKRVSATKTFCLDCLAKLARLNLKLKHEIEIDQQTMLNMLRDECGVW